MIWNAGIFGEPIGKYFGREVWDYWPIYKVWLEEEARVGGYQVEETLVPDAVLDQVQSIGLQPAWELYLDKAEGDGKPARKVFNESGAVLEEIKKKYEIE